MGYQPSIRGIPTIEFPKLAKEYYENTPEALRIKRAVEFNRRMRDSKRIASLHEVEIDPTLTLAEKLEARRKIESRARVAEATDSDVAELNAYREEKGQLAKRDLANAFSDDPNGANRYQEINYQPGVGVTGGLAMSKTEQVRTAQQNAAFEGHPFTTDQEIAALKAQGSQLLPQELQDRYNAEQRGRLSAFDTAAEDEAKSTFAGNQAQAKAASKVKRDQAAARGQTPVRINENDFRFNSGGTMQRGGQAFEVSPGLGADRATTEVKPYGMAPADFIAPAPAVKKAPTVPSYPTVSRIGWSRPLAEVIG